MSKLHRSQLLKEIKTSFPEIGPDINAQDGLLHMEVTVFRLFTQNQIDAGNREAVAKCFQIAEKHYVGGNHQMQNAIDVSYVEGLEFGGKKAERRWAWSVIPNNLRQLYVKFHGKEGA